MAEKTDGEDEVLILAPEDEEGDEDQATDEDLGDDSADLEAADVAVLEEPDPHPEQVSYSGSDFDVEGLVRRLERGDIVIPTFGHDVDDIETARFQRSFVWSKPQMDRFIESLLLGYPIPGIFLVQQSDRRYLVLDGQQRLATLMAFYRGVHASRVFALNNVGDVFKGLTYAELSPDQRRTIDNTFIQATIVKTDGSPDSLDAVYQVFERLNAGGTQLTPHEIRIALYAGQLIDFLVDLNSLENWRALWGPPSPRLRDQEAILRIIALYIAPGTYKRPLKKFLNEFVATHRDLGDLDADLIRERFEQVSSLLLNGPRREALRVGGGAINVALTEAIYIGIARRLDSGEPPSPEAVSDAVQTLMARGDLGPSISRATADEESVRTRLATAAQVFGAI